ncbi:putative ribosome biogenesis protein RLP24 [Capsicum chinense]|nr:putative ribosome biogenesis protein RLP24 [Capsicum chinense]
MTNTLRRLKLAEFRIVSELTVSGSPDILKGYLSSITEIDTDTKTETVGGSCLTDMPYMCHYGQAGSNLCPDWKGFDTVPLDSTFEFERKRNRPDRYDRNVTENTLKAIKKIDKIKVDREERTIAKRMKGKTAKEQREAAKELEQRIHLVPVPEKHCLSRSRGLRKGSRRKIAGGMIILLPILYILKLKHKSFHAYFYGMCNVLLSPTSRICMVWQLSLVSIETLLLY